MTSISRDALPQTDDEIEAAFDDLGYGVTVNCVSYFTADMIADLRAARKSWTQPGSVEEDTDDLLLIRDAQAVKGQRRRDVVAVRFGDYCAVYGSDM